MTDVYSMTLDPEAQTFCSGVRALYESDSLTDGDFDAPRLRQMSARLETLLLELGATKIAIAAVSDHKIPGPEHEITIRVYKPHGEEPMPVVFYFHGGGWALGDLNTADGVCRQITAGTQAIVISVAYRLAPEHPFPAAIEDAYATFQYVISRAKQFAVNPVAIAVAGDSAGATIATVLAILAKDRGGPRIVTQVLAYPITSPVRDAGSYRKYGEHYLLTTHLMRWFCRAYVSRASDATNPLAFPLLSPNLSGLPPAVVVLAGHDPLYDDGFEYAEALNRAGVPTIVARYPGMVHGFFTTSGALSAGVQAVRLSTDILRRAFNAALST